MTTGERIRSVRKERGLTQKALGELLGVTQATVAQYETNPNPPKIETLRRIADALAVPVLYLIDESQNWAWTVALGQKMAHIGYSIGFYEEDAMLWINYPDGTLEVTEAELEELNSSADSYLHFKLEELKAAHIDSFRSQK